MSDMKLKSTTQDSIQLYDCKTKVICVYYHSRFFAVEELLLDKSCNALRWREVIS